MNREPTSGRLMLPRDLEGTSGVLFFAILVAIEVGDIPHRLVNGAKLVAQGDFDAWLRDYLDQRPRGSDDEDAFD